MSFLSANSCCSDAALCTRVDGKRPRDTAWCASAGCINHLHTFTELQGMVVSLGIGFVVLGFLGFFVKLIHIPINNILVGA